MAEHGLIAVTGATGFIGRHLVGDLKRRGYRVRLLLRRPADVPAEADGVVIGDLARPINLSQAFEGVAAVVHSAGLAHAMSGRPADDFRAINATATLTLADAARRAGVKRFVFLSSVRAQVGPSAPRPVSEGDSPRPIDDYGRSKLQAEQGLGQLDLDWVALRPVLVYGPGAVANMATLMRLAASPLPLPLASLQARRSILSVDNLASAVAHLLALERNGLRRPYLVADEAPMTIGEIVAALRAGLSRGPGLVPFPPALLRLGAAAAGKADLFERVATGLIVDTTALRESGWRPERASGEALAAYARQAMAAA